MFYVVLYKKKVRQVWYNFHFFHIACIFWFTCNYLLHDLFTQGKSYCPVVSGNMIFLWWIDIFTSSETSYMCLPTKFIKNITTATVQKNNSDMNYWEKNYWHQCLDVSDISGENFYSQKNYQQITNIQTCFTDLLSNVPPASDRQTGKQTDRQMCFLDLLSKCSPCFIRNCDPCSHCLSRSCSREAGKSLKTQTGHPLGHRSSIRSLILLSRLLSDYMLTRYLTTIRTSEAFLSPWVFF